MKTFVELMEDIKSADKKPELYTEASGKQKYRMVSKNNVVMKEKTLTPAEKKKREEIAKAMERENPGMDMSKKMAIATAAAKRVAEEVELDEISKQTLGSYIKKAASDIGYAASADDTNKELKRHKGIAKAVNKLTKEEVELDEAVMQGSKEHLKKLQGMLDKVKPGSVDHSQIRGAIESKFGKQHIPSKHRNVKPDMYEEVELDEISKSTLGRYASKALQRGDIAARMSKSDSDSMGKIANKRLTGVKKAVDRIAPKAAATRIKTNVDKSKEAARNRYTDKDDEGKAYYAAQKGISKVREEVELDEISKKTLVNYINKANVNAMDHASKSGQHNNPNAQKHFSKAMDRMHNIKKAADRLIAKEEVKLDELSPVTLGKYSQKARVDALDHSGGPWGKKKDSARVAKRLSGDAMAVKKLNKIRGATSKND